MWDTFLCNLTYDDIWRGHVSLATSAKYECVIFTEMWYVRYIFFFLIWHIMTYKGVTYTCNIVMWDMNVWFDTEHICIKSQWVRGYALSECQVTITRYIWNTYVYQVTMGVQTQVSISNLSLLGLFQTKRGKIDLEN